MRLPDYAESRRRAGIARAEEMRRVAALLRRFIRRKIRSFQNGGRPLVLQPARVRSRRWPAPYDMSQNDTY